MAPANSAPTINRLWREDHLAELLLVLVYVSGSDSRKVDTQALAQLESLQGDPRNLCLSEVLWLMLKPGAPESQPTHSTALG